MIKICEYKKLRIEIRLRKSKHELESSPNMVKMADGVTTSQLGVVCTTYKPIAEFYQGWTIWQNQINEKARILQTVVSISKAMSTLSSSWKMYGMVAILEIDYLDEPRSIDDIRCFDIYK